MLALTTREKITAIFIVMGFLLGAGVKHWKETKRTTEWIQIQQQ